MTLNIDELKESLSCDNEFLAHLMEKFVNESGEDTHKLKMATDAKNWMQVRGIAHKMLSSTRIFNIDELSNLLEEIETAAEKKTNVERIPEEVTAVEGLWKDVVEEVNHSLKKLRS